MNEQDTRDEELIDVVRDTVNQLERLTKRLQSFIDHNEGAENG
jgi:hypothetical protein